MYLAFKNLIISTKNKSNVVRNPKAKYEWCFSRLNFSKTSAADAVTTWTAKNYGNNVFERKQTKKKVPPNIFGGFEEGKNVSLIFWTPNATVKIKCYGLSGCKQRNGVCLVSLDCKLTQKRTIVYAFSRKKTVEKTFTDNQTINKKTLMFLDGKVLTEI